MGPGSLDPLAVVAPPRTALNPEGRSKPKILLPAAPLTSVSKPFTLVFRQALVAPGGTSSGHLPALLPQNC